MKISRAQAERLVETYCDDVPLVDAVERAIHHDWSFPVTGDHEIERSAGRQREVDLVLYGVE